MKKFFAIGGHCISENRIEHAIELITALRTQWPDSFISFCSHITVEERIQRLCDLVLIDKNNLMGNADFSNSHTRQYKHYFWQLPRPGFNISKTIPYKHYANHRQYHDLSVVLTELYDARAITFFTYDCEPIVSEKLSLHYELLEKYDAIFYDFYTPCWGASVNTEFFTLSSHAIQNGMRKIFRQDDYFSFNNITEFTLEQIYYALMKREKIDFKVLDKREENEGRFGVIAQHDKQEKIDLPLLDPQHPDVMICPFLDWTEGKIQILVFMYHHHLPQESYLIKLKFTNENGDESSYKFAKKLNHNNWVLLDIAPGFPIVNVYKEDECIFKFDLGNNNNYGVMERS
jgi:hypothetical protein